MPLTDSCTWQTLEAIISDVMRPGRGAMGDKGSPLPQLLFTMASRELNGLDRSSCIGSPAFELAPCEHCTCTVFRDGYLPAVTKM